MKLPFRKRPSKQLLLGATPGTTGTAAAAASSGRGDFPPAIMLFGVMPRSGSVHVAELLSLHPDIAAHPNNLWEVPFLENTDKLVDFHEGFLQGYHQNAERMGQDDMLAIFGGAFVNYLYQFASTDQTVLTKETSTQFLHRFPTVFPQESLILQMRDGRDLVGSSIRTWPGLDFAELCQRWSDSTHRMLDFLEIHSRKTYWFVRFEDILAKPRDFVVEACERFQLNRDAYPFKEQENVKIIGSSTMSEAGGVSWDAHVDAPKDFRPKSHWLQWSTAQKRTFKKLAGPALVRAGYVDNDQW